MEVLKVTLLRRLLCKTFISAWPWSPLKSSFIDNKHRAQAPLLPRLIFLIQVDLAQGDFQVFCFLQRISKDSPVKITGILDAYLSSPMTEYIHCSVICCPFAPIFFLPLPWISRCSQQLWDLRHLAAATVYFFFNTLLYFALLRCFALLCTCSTVFCFWYIATFCNRYIALFYCATVFCFAVLCYVMFYFAMLCFATLYFAIICFLMLCFAELTLSSWYVLCPGKCFARSSLQILA